MISTDNHDPINAALARMGLIEAGARPHLEALGGGVSSEIYRADLAGQSICIKRALPKLKVAADWQAPLERNAFEYAWLRTAADIVPEAVPATLAADPEGGAFAMAFLAPEHYPVWKRQLRDGIVEAATARAAAQRLAAIHAATAGHDDIARRFATDAIFHALRIEPYLLATAQRHADVASRLQELAAVTARTKQALVHGDVSPKNILDGPDGPVFVDAECAWYGDPAFDLAFCLNHFLLKCLWRPQFSEPYLDSFAAFARVYLEGVTWAPPEQIEARAAHLLPALLLARVDGKSPVEYITLEAERDRVRRFSKRFLIEPMSGLDQLREAWRQGTTFSLGRNPG